MPIAHKIEPRPPPDQADDLDRACGTRRQCHNQPLAPLSQPSVTWSKAAAYQDDITVLRVEFPWSREASSRVARNAIDDLDSAFQGFFRRVKRGVSRFDSPATPISKRAGRFFASALVDTEAYNPHAPLDPSVGVDFGIEVA